MELRLSCTNPSMCCGVGFYTSWPAQNGCHFAEDILKCKEKIFHFDLISLEFVCGFQIGNKSAMIQVMAWHQIGNDIMPWKRLPYCWPFVRGIHWSPAYSPHEEPVLWSFDVYFVVSLDKLFTLLSAWTNCWTNNQVASDLRSTHVSSLLWKFSKPWPTLAHLLSHADPPALSLPELSPSVFSRRDSVLGTKHGMACSAAYHVSSCVGGPRTIPTK